MEALIRYAKKLPWSHSTDGGTGAHCVSKLLCPWSRILWRQIAYLCNGQSRFLDLIWKRGVFIIPLCNISLFTSHYFQLRAKRGDWFCLPGSRELREIPPDGTWKPPQTFPYLVPFLIFKFHLLNSSAFTFLGLSIFSLSFFDIASRKSTSPTNVNKE